MKSWKLTTGGWLSILNGVGWLILVAVSKTGAWKSSFYLVLFMSMTVLSLPVAWIPLLPGMLPWDARGIVVTSCVIGLNSFLWGYGLAAILRSMTRRRHPPSAPLS